MNAKHSRKLSDENGAASRRRDGQSELDSIQALLAQVVALGDYAEHFAAARLDGLRVALRNRLLRILVLGGGFILAAAFAVAAWGFWIRGLAGGLAAALGHRTWLGELLAGVVGLTMTAGTIGWLALHLRSSWRRERVRKYERLKARQRKRSGHDVDQAARKRVRR